MLCSQADAIPLNTVFLTGDSDEGRMDMAHLVSAGEVGPRCATYCSLVGCSGPFVSSWLYASPRAHVLLIARRVSK